MPTEIMKPHLMNCTVATRNFTGLLWIPFWRRYARCSAYFDTSVFLAIFNKEPSGPQIRSLLPELKHERVRIYTSIISIQEVSVLSFRKGGAGDDNYVKLGKLARIETITREIALLAARIEAQLIDLLPKDQEDNKRRKWDCFHIATAMHLGRRNSIRRGSEFDKKEGYAIGGIDFRLPRPKAPIFSLQLRCSNTISAYPPTFFRLTLPPCAGN